MIPFSIILNNPSEVKRLPNLSQEMISPWSEDSDKENIGVERV